MNRDTFTAWVNTLIRAWENRDAQAAADLFTNNATYQENPFDEPLRGRAAIRAYWADVPRTQDRHPGRFRGAERHREQRRRALVERRIRASPLVNV